jgi:cytochrome P450
MNALASPDACKGFMDAFMAAQRDVVIPIAQRTKEYYTWCKTVLDYIDDRIDEASMRVADPENHTLDSKQVRIVDELWKTTKDRYSLRYLILGIFSPAHDTVAITVANAMFHLARNRECWIKLRAEILPTATRPLTYDLLNSYKYLTWVLRESQLPLSSFHYNIPLTVLLKLNV